MLAIAFVAPAAAESVVAVERPFCIGPEKHRLHGHAAGRAGRASLWRLPFAVRGAFEILPDVLGHGCAARAETALIHDPFGMTDPAIGLAHDRILALYAEWPRG
jgi:hypothetical protein